MSSFKRESITHYIGHLYRLGAAFLTKEYAAHIIGFGQYQFLMQLYLEDGLSHEDLTARLHADRSTTTRVIEKLYWEGYVAASQQETDKRKYRTYLTDKARSKQIEILDIAAEWETKMTECLSEAEKNTLYLLL